jgi:hypothetical protein
MTEPEEFRALVERAAAMPARLAAALGERAASAHATTPEVEEWSPAEILAHLRASDDILAIRAYMLLAREEPPLPVFDERRWAEVAGYARLPIADSLAVYGGRRAELVAMLRAVPPDAWARAGIREGFGRLTLLELLGALVEHEEEHCAQLEALPG